MNKRVLGLGLSVVLTSQLVGCQAIKNRFVVDEPTQSSTPVFGEIQQEQEKVEDTGKVAFKIGTDIDVNDFMSKVGVITTGYTGNSVAQEVTESEENSVNGAEVVQEEEQTEASFEIKPLMVDMHTENFGTFSAQAGQELDEEDAVKKAEEESLAALEAESAAETSEDSESEGSTEVEEVEITIPEEIPVQEVSIKRAAQKYNRLLGNGIDEMTTLEWIDNLQGLGFVPSRLAITTTYIEDGYTIEQAESIAPVTPGEVVHVGVVLNQKYLAALRDNAANEKISHMGYLVSFTLYDNPNVRLTVGEVNRFDRMTGELECMYTSVEFSGDDEEDTVRFGKDKTTWSDLLQQYSSDLNYNRLEYGLNSCDILRTNGQITSLKFSEYTSQEAIDYLNNFTKVDLGAEDEAMKDKLEKLGKVYWNNRILNIDEIVEIKDLVVALDRLSLFGFTPVSYRKSSTGSWNEYSAADFAQVKRVYKRLLEGERDELTISMYLVAGNTDNAESGDVTLKTDEEIIDESLVEEKVQTTNSDGSLQVQKGSADNIIGAEYKVLIDKGQIQKTELSINRAGVYTEIYKVNSQNVPEFSSMSYIKLDGDSGVEFTTDKLVLQGAGQEVLSKLCEGLEMTEGSEKYLRSSKYRIGVSTEATNAGDVRAITFTRYWK